MGGWESRRGRVGDSPHDRSNVLASSEETGITKMHLI